jgi:hypothetical protein
MDKILSWETNSGSAAYKISDFYVNLWLIAVFIRARHWSLFWGRGVQYTPSQPISLRTHFIFYCKSNTFFLMH